MAFMTVTTVVTDLDIDSNAVLAALQFAKKNNGHLEVICLGVDRTQPGFYYAGANAMALQSNLAQAEKTAAELEAGVKELLQHAIIPWGTRAVSAQLPGLAQFLAHRMRYTDMTVLSQPYGEGRDHVNEVIVESSLFDAKVPVLVMPDSAEIPDPIERVVIAWNESQEALTAVRLALPILKSAKVVNIAMVDPPAHALDRSDPGGALAQMLSRHGVSAEVSVLAKTVSRVSDVIARHLVDQNANMLVMGAYGHSRIRESILGGATRNTLQMAKLPVFMAH